MIKIISPSIIFFLFSIKTFAGFNLDIDAKYRSLPSGYNLVGTAAYDDVFWGTYDKTRPLYGFYKVGAKLGGSPTAAGFLQISPIAPLVFEVQKSATYRFLNSTVFNCDFTYCFGVVDRTDYTMKLALAYKNVLLVSSFLLREIRTPSSSQNIGLELEYFDVTPGFHRYSENNQLLGYKLNDTDVVGLFFTQSEISEGNRRSKSIYGIYRWKWEDYALTAGAGQYDTDMKNNSGPGVLFLINRKFGDTISLF